MARKSKKPRAKKPAPKKPTRRAKAAKSPVAAPVAASSKAPRVILFDPPHDADDVVDGVIALLDTADMALSSREAFGEGNYDVFAVRAVLSSAIKMLRPIGTRHPGPRG